MAEFIQGYAALQRRIAAIKGPVIGKSVMRELAMATVRESKLLVHHKTRNLARSIHAAEIGESSARVVASAKYAAYVELGTRPHEITPRARQALRWAASPAGQRLTGTPTKAAQRGGAGGVVFAKRVHHPGTRPYPFMKPGAEKAIRSAGLADRIVAAWNGAA
jgi:hypothetical protein